ncbi:multi antimicrobial extrusion protein [Artemisia annua]|uniref:Multi antimicrobial extrusion protein n=1 Tax=Artemisia annua TaxID=35608 RepID=A0A2U1P216_ARTAN|nr:multi antimicrobial extrusion protein [Artemisia annua]
MQAHHYKMCPWETVTGKQRNCLSYGRRWIRRYNGELKGANEDVGKIAMAVFPCYVTKEDEEAAVDLFAAEIQKCLSNHKQSHDAVDILNFHVIEEKGFSIIWAFTGKFFEYFGQDLDISKEAGNFACWLIPNIFPYGLLQCQIIFLQTQNNVKSLMLSTGFASLLHVICCWTS